MFSRGEQETRTLVLVWHANFVETYNFEIEPAVIYLGLQLVGFAKSLVDRNIFAEVGCNCLAAFCEFKQLSARGRVV